MYTSFEEKKIKLLADLKMLALKHNRDYYISLIPQVESATESDDIIDLYREAIEQDSMRLAQSRDAFVTVGKISSLL